jgi:hypothetical protein
MTKHPVKFVYIAGPIRGKDLRERELNIRRAETICIELAKMGIMSFCPQAQGRFMPDELPWIELDLAVLPRFSGMVMAPGWQWSEGANIERNRMRKLGSPIAYWPQDIWKLEEWAGGKPWSVLETASLS